MPYPFEKTYVSPEITPIGRLKMVHCYLLERMILCTKCTHILKLFPSVENTHTFRKEVRKRYGRGKEEWAFRNPILRGCFLERVPVSRYHLGCLPLVPIARRLRWFALTYWDITTVILFFFFF